MNILGINAYHGNASAAIVCDGHLVAAVEEERFNRVKYAAGFPTQAIRYCLREAGLTLADIHHVAVPRNQYARLATKLFYSLRMPSFARERVRVIAKFTGIPEALVREFDADAKKLRARFHRVEHHRAHLASSFYCSPFERAALLSADGLGDFASTMWGVGQGHRMLIDGAVAFPHSLGLFYTAVTQYLGFLKFGDEYKVMGLSATSCALIRIRTETDSGWGWITLRTIAQARKCPGRKQTKRRCSAQCFRLNWQGVLARFVLQRSRWSSVTEIWLLRCKHASKRFISAC